MDLVHPRTLAIPRNSRWRTRLACRVWGHHVDNHIFRKDLGPHRWCRCGEVYLTTDGGHTRVRHTLSCFLGHHTYVPVAERDGHHEPSRKTRFHGLLLAPKRAVASRESQGDGTLNYL